MITEKELIQIEKEAVISSMKTSDEFWSNFQSLVDLLEDYDTESDEFSSILERINKLYKKATSEAAKADEIMQLRIEMYGDNK